MTPDRIWAWPTDVDGWSYARCSDAEGGYYDNEVEYMPATPHHAAQLLLSYLEKDNDKRQLIDPSGHCVKLIHGLRAIAEEGK